MKKICTYILVMSFFISCFFERTTNKSTIYEQEFSAILNDLIRMKLLNTSIIDVQTKAVTKTMFQEIITTWKTKS